MTFPAAKIPGTQVSPRVDDKDVPGAARVLGSGQSDPGQRVDARAKPGTGHDGVSVEDATVGQLDTGHVALRTDDEPADLAAFDDDSGGSERAQDGFVDAGRVV